MLLNFDFLCSSSPLFLFIRSSIHLCIHQSIHPSIHPPTHLPVCLSTNHTPIYLSPYVPTYMSVCPSVYLVTSLKSPRTMIQSRVLQSVSSPAPARQSVCPARSCVTRDTKQGGGCVTIFRHLNINSFPFRC